MNDKALGKLATSIVHQMYVLFGDITLSEVMQKIREEDEKVLDKVT